MADIEEATKSTEAKTEIQFEAQKDKKVPAKLSLNTATLVFFVAIAAILGLFIYASGAGDTRSSRPVPISPMYMKHDTNHRYYDGYGDGTDENYSVPMGPQGQYHYRTR